MTGITFNDMKWRTVKFNLEFVLFSVQTVDKFWLSSRRPQQESEMNTSNQNAPPHPLAAYSCKCGNSVPVSVYVCLSETEEKCS